MIEKSLKITLVYGQKEVMKMAKTLEEFERALQEGKKPGVSQYQMRDENAQTVSRKSIKKLKRELGKRAKLCIFKEIAIPWNPFTGKEDDTYNQNSKFRPTTSVTSTIRLLKEMAEKYPDGKAALAKYAGLKPEEWDTSDSDVITENDRVVVAPHIFPRIFTLQAAKIDIPAMTGAYGREYKVKVDTDPLTGEYVGEVPLIIKVNQFMRAMAYEAMQEYNKRIESGEINPTDKEKKEAIRAIFEKVVVQEPRPSNHVMGVEIKLGTSCDFDDATVKEVRRMTVDGIRKALFVTKCSKKQGSGIQDVITEYMQGVYPKYDKHLDYFEIDMKCPLEVDDLNNKGAVGLGTTYGKPEYFVGSDVAKIMDSDNAPKPDSSVFDKALQEYLEGAEDVEHTILNSVKIGTYNEDVERRLLMALPTVVDLSSKYLTDSVIRNHKDLLIAAFGEEGQELVDRVEENMSGKAAGEYSANSEQEMRKDVTLQELLQSSEDTVDDLGLTNIE